MRTFPTWLPPEVRVNPPARRVKALIDETHDLKQSDGDLYYYMRGNIVPLSPDQDQVIVHVHMITDEDGFRNSPPQKARYDIVAQGDSFTRASGVASPWSEKLAEYTGNDVLNLGEVGFGPQDELKVLRQYGLKKQPKWVIIAYFEGNDLYDAASYEQANPFILTRFIKYMLTQGLEALQDNSAVGNQVVVASSYRYPIRVAISNTDLELTFFSPYISWSSISGERIEASQNYHLVQRAILRARDLSEAEESRFLLVFVPTKEHIYLPYLNDPKTLATVFADVPALELDEKGFIQLTDQKTTPEFARQHMDDQADLLADFAVEHNINYLDLTPYFREEAGTGRYCITLLTPIGTSLVTTWRPKQLMNTLKKCFRML